MTLIAKNYFMTPPTRILIYIYNRLQYTADYLSLAYKLLKLVFVLLIFIKTN